MKMRAIVALFLLAVPSFVPVVAACVLGGIVAALVRTRIAPAPGSQVSSAGPLFLAGLGAALLVSSASGFSALFAACVTGGVAAAYALNRASLSRRLVTIRP